jgi:8-amino-7-oxononanoate synthase
MMNWQQAVAIALKGRRDAHGFRERRVVRALDATHVEIDGRRCVNFASNNYLGLTHHPRIIQAFQSAAKTGGVGSGAAALVSGYAAEHAAAERAIATWKGTEASVLLGSGYVANLAAVQTLTAVAGERGVRFLLDKLCHASLIDAVRGSGADFRIFPHNDLNKLKRLLENAEEDQLQVVATESIFSMDGDAADLPGLATLKKTHAFLLLLDEAHASGVYGPKGAGYAAQLGLQPIVDISVVTLSKAIGVYGGAICGSRDFCDSVVNFGRSYIFSTNVPVAIAAAVEVAIDVLRTEPERQERLARITADFRSGLRESGFVLPPGDSPIVPILLGDEATALAMADQLLEEGLLVVAIRPPTVPRGGSRLRITLSSEHQGEEVERLVAALAAVARSSVSG